MGQSGVEWTVAPEVVLWRGGGAVAAQCHVDGDQSSGDVEIGVCSCARLF